MCEWVFTFDLATRSAYADVGPSDYVENVREALEQSGWCPLSESGRPMLALHVEYFPGMPVIEVQSTRYAPWVLVNVQFLWPETELREAIIERIVRDDELLRASQVLALQGDGDAFAMFLSDQFGGLPPHRE
jgi:hypothetical protein